MPSCRRRLADALLPVALTLALTAALASGCASMEPPVERPGGVDGLVIPTPDPQPGDFVEGIDNPWLAWTPGRVLRYSDGSSLTVTDTSRAVEGVTTTQVTTTAADGTTTTDLYAQDTAGNVWSFGRIGVWQAGEDGAEPGLWMPADPRRGDGWRTGYAEGAAVEVATVLGLDGTVQVGEEEHDDALVVQLTGVPASSEQRLFWLRGTGLAAVVDGSVTRSLVATEG